MTDPTAEFRRKRGRLNRAQAEAVDAMQGGWADQGGAFVLPVVEGPPGTGKTTVGVLAAVQQILENPRSSVAYLAFTNFAAIKAKEEFEKLGFGPRDVARVTADLDDKDWEHGVVGCDWKLGGLSPDGKRRLQNARVLISTLHSSNRVFQLLGNPLIVIDEFSQVSPPLFFHTMSRVTTGDYNPLGYALLGDPDQLPVITTQQDLRPNIGTFLLAMKGDIGSQQLVTQYRMNRRIRTAVNALRAVLHTYPLQDGELDGESVGSRTLTSLHWHFDAGSLTPAVREILSPDHPLVYIDTDGLPGWEQVAFGESKYYPEEAQLAAYLMTRLEQSYSKTGVGSLKPVVLSPYNAQVQELKSLLDSPNSKSRCLTVYTAQGREYPAVIVSFVRKNLSRTIGFLDEPQLRAQTYVACSRAEAKLILLFSHDTFGGYPDYRALLENTGDAAIRMDGREVWSEVQ